jgi:Na+-transporting methylmalonyl-CoA/oxaloacetate decarboxylase beta subunit
MHHIENFFRSILLFARWGGRTQAHSIGIIGGADGPTAVFIAEKNAYPGVLLPGGLAVALLFGVAVIAAIFFRRK